MLNLMPLGSFNFMRGRFRMFAAKSLLRTAVLAAVTLSASHLWLATAHGAKQEMQVTEKDRNYWAFRPLAEGPPLRSGLNPVDAFLFAKDTPPPTNAARTTLIRRLYLDVLGLPPTPARWTTSP